jgi:hypothetical protein
MAKSSTKKIVLFEPDQGQLTTALHDRHLCPELIKFLTNLLKAKKWTRKINIPSNHNDVAAVLVFTTALKEGGLEILSELHVYYAGKVLVEKWQVVGENDEISDIPREMFSAIDILKVRADGSRVTIEFNAPVAEAPTLSKVFDFAQEGSTVRFVPHPFLEFVSLTR